MNIVLASQSPRRRELLSKITESFTVCPANTDETLPQGISPENAVLALAQEKAAEIASRKEYRSCCVIAADTVVAIDGKILGKPRDRADAVRMLTLLSGRTHTVYTGMTVQTPDDCQTSVTATQVTFFPLSGEEIASYADTREPYDKAGGYGIQGRGGLLVSGISGDYYNVMGLPVAVLYRQLRELKLLSPEEKV